MDDATRPIFTLYVAWHPSFKGGREIADRLHRHFGRDLYSGIEEERGVSVLERSEAAQGAPAPLAVDWDDTEITAVVILSEATLVGDPEWINYVRGLAQEARQRGIQDGFFPVALDREGLNLGIPQQALRWDSWQGSVTDRVRRLTMSLTHEFCRMLRHRLERFRNTDGKEATFGRYLENIRVFISHSKHDDVGEPMARSIRDWLHAESPLGSFFDVHDIPPGLPFADVLMHTLGEGAVLALHTDSYSSREWCRREVIEAKRRLVPMLVVDCLRDTDPRGMAYLGNVPIVRMEPEQADRFETVAGRLLDEVFRNWLWLCRVGSHLADCPGTVFTARPPELTVLGSGGDAPISMVVYPEPLLSADEQRLFRKIAPGVELRTLTEWLEERP